jgi:hypothetical protein
MPIITQLNATKLRSLKYGNDTSDGGNSGQPYIKTELKDLDKPLTRVRLTKFDDGLIRGGHIGALNASIVDTIRIGKFLKDFPKGPLFIAKQVGLQLSNPKLETKKGLGGLLGSTRLYNLGINTLRQIPITAFGGHLTRHGLFPVTDDSIKYIKVVAENNKNSDDNRLVALTNKFTLGDQIGGVGEEFSLREERRENRAANREGRQANRDDNRFNRRLNRFVNRRERKFNRKWNQDRKQWDKEFNANNFVRSNFTRSGFTRTDFKRNKLDVKSLLEQFTIDSYNGGPNSLYGIGRTTINRYAFTDDKRKIQEAFDEAESKTTDPDRTEFKDPLTEQSRIDTGEWDIGSISNPLSPRSNPLNNIKEEFQFKAIKRNPETKFFYGAGISTSKLQSDIGNGNINVVEPVTLSPAINPVISAPFDKFSVIKYTKENTDYTNKTREIRNQTVEETGKNEFEIKIKLRNVKASIVDVKQPIADGKLGLEETYTTGSMVSFPITEIEHTTNNGNSVFKTKEVSVDREADKYGSFYYLNKRKTVPNFDRNDRDIMLVSFTPINPFEATNLRNVVMVAYISGFKYNSNSTWNPVKYVGRSESFYTFTEHKRDVSFNLQIPCFNETELREKHRGLGELLAIGSGTYDDNNRLGGVITKLTLGSYLVEEPGILTSVSFDIPDTSSWDLDYKLAMYINAQFSFTLIGKELPTYDREIQGGFFKNIPDAISGYLGSTNAI